jgi:hypothetical protein
LRKRIDAGSTVSEHCALGSKRLDPKVQRIRILPARCMRGGPLERVPLDLLGARIERIGREFRDLGLFVCKSRPQGQT